MSSNVIEKLDSMGITIEKIIEAAMALYVTSEQTDTGKTKRTRSKLKDMIIRQTEDINIESLLMAAIFLDEKRFAPDDPVCLISDELIGMDISEYIGGKKALFNFVRYDKEKPGILSELGPFLDDAIGGLIAGCMTKICDEENESHN